ncbi:hypothetical protein [Maribacter dokdonensis]|nr:hypothetical protein [Maribacter dokdonensis]
MKTSEMVLNKSILILFIFYSCITTMKAQDYNKNGDLDQIPNEIITQSLSNPNLWKESNLSFNTTSTLYVLNHGVDLDIPTNTIVSGKPVVLINKGDIYALGNPPYFLFHTLKIDDSKAFVRLYLSFDVNGKRKTNNTEIYFLKTQNGWEITNNQL